MKAGQRKAICTSHTSKAWLTLGKLLSPCSISAEDWASSPREHLWSGVSRKALGSLNPAPASHQGARTQGGLPCPPWSFLPTAGLAVEGQVPSSDIPLLQEPSWSPQPRLTQCCPHSSLPLLRPSCKFWGLKFCHTRVLPPVPPLSRWLLFHAPS